MKKRTKILSLFSTCIIPLTGMITVLTSCNSGVDETVGSLKYEETQDGTIEITGLNNTSKKIKTITVPSTINGKKVSSIAKGAFKNCPSLNTITLPFIGESEKANGVEAMFGYIFGEETYDGCGPTTWQECDTENNGTVQTESAGYCIPMSLENVVITNATTIPAGAFSNCIYLENITINKHTSTEIKNKAFMKCIALNSFDFTCVEGLTTIGNYAFKSCETFSTITLPSTVVEVGDYAFASCESCASIRFASNIEHVGAYACSGISGVILTDATEQTVKDKWDENWADYNAIVVYEFESGNTRFQTNDWLGLVCGSGNSKYIYLTQWMGGWSQTEITVPSSLTSNGVTLPVKIVGGRTFQENVFIKQVIIEEGVEQIFPQTFADCTSLKYVSFPESLKHIRSGAFEGCTNLIGHYEEGVPVNKILLNGVTEIGDFAFRNCSSIQEVEFKKVEKIGDEAFAYCTHLCPDTSIDTENCLLIPKTCKSLGEGAFKYCFKYAPNSITANTYYPTVKFEDKNIIEVIPNNCFEWCGVRVTKPTEGWDKGVQYPKTIRVNINLNGAPLTKIGDYAFNNCWISSLKGARNTHIKYIGDYAFYYAQMTSDTSATSESKGDLQMDQEIEYIGDYAFAYCSTVQSLTFNTAIDYPDKPAEEKYYNSLKHLGHHAFYACSNQDFNKLDLSPCVHLLNSKVANEQTGEEPAEFNPEKEPNLTPRFAFAACTNLKEVYLPGSYEYVENYKGLTPTEKQAIIDANPCKFFTRLPDRFFESCTNLGNIKGWGIVIPKQINDIRYAVFNGCSYQEHVYINGAIQWLGSSIFNNNYSLLTITKSDGTAVEFNTEKFTNSTVGNNIYNNCYKLQTAPIPIVESDSLNFNLREQMYYQNKKLSTIKLPFNCVSIGTKAFMNCEALTTVEFNKSQNLGYSKLDTINTYAFSGCSDLDSINLEDTNLRYIYGYAFDGCKKLMSITLPTRNIPYLYNTPFAGWSPTNGTISYATVRFAKKHTNKYNDSSWTSTETTWPTNFSWRVNQSGITLNFTRKTDANGAHYYTCDNNACGGTSIHFVPYDFN